jgi:hypothetical protein
MKTNNKVNPNHVVTTCPATAKLRSTYVPPHQDTTPLQAHRCHVRSHKIPRHAPSVLLVLCTRTRDTNNDIVRHQPAEHTRFSNVWILSKGVIIMIVNRPVWWNLNQPSTPHMAHAIMINNISGNISQGPPGMARLVRLGAWTGWTTPLFAAGPGSHGRSYSPWNLEINASGNPVQNTPRTGAGHTTSTQSTPL